ncbi:MAG TPA: RagB/SusD family nutrient uptake outer membrane protein [Flavobacterium sp.]
MKRIISKIVFVALFSSAIISCNDATDIVQKSELNEDVAFQSVEDLQTGLNGVYAQYGPDFGGNGDGDVILFNDLFTDNIKRGAASNNQGATEYNFILQPATDFPARIWGNRYATINYANRVLRAADRITADLTNPAEIAQANHIRGQLLALRGLCHFDLLQYFTEDYEDPNGLAVIIMDFVPEIEQSFERNTVSEVFEFVNNDLVTAKALLDGSQEDIFYITPDAVDAMRARVALFQGNYSLAETLAEELVEKYPLANQTQYLDMWADGLSSELIWSLSRVANDNAVAGLFYANETDIDGSPFFEMSNQLYNLYEDGDVRKIAFVDETSIIVGENSPENVILINKYPGSVQNLVNDIKMFRSSEMQLIAAECQARDGRFAEAIASLQALRNARYGEGAPEVPEFTNLTAALTEVLVERRKELAFEGHRFLDLKRIGREIGIGIDRLEVDAASFTAQTDLSPTDYRFTMPIPQAELNANNVITQNPGY